MRRNPSGILEDAGDSPVAVLNHNKPAAYLLSARAYEALLDKLEDFELTKIVKERQGSETVKVTLPDGHPNSPTCGHLKFPHPERSEMTG
nr:type II toxin-antitoxin system prevent-host-death family antitoxin [Rhodoferax sp.]